MGIFSLITRSKFEFNLRLLFVKFRNRNGAAAAPAAVSTAVSAAAPTARKGSSRRSRAGLWFLDATTARGSARNRRGNGARRRRGGSACGRSGWGACRCRTTTRRRRSAARPTPASSFGSGGWRWSGTPAEIPNTLVHEHARKRNSEIRWKVSGFSVPK